MEHSVFFFFFDQQLKILGDQEPDPFFVEMDCFSLVGNETSKRTWNHESLYRSLCKNCTCT